MHDTLRTSEIVDTVCSFASQPTLFSLARTCRAFEEPALNHLWKELDGLEPLLQFFPHHHNPNGEQEWEWDPTGLPSERIRRYTSNVTDITVDIPSIDSDFLASCLKRGSSTRMFPKLKVVRIFTRELSLNIIPIIQWVIGPSVILIQWSIESVRPNKEVTDFMSSLGSICPQAATELDLHNNQRYRDYWGEQDPIQTISQIIYNSNHLVRGSFDYLDPAAYQYLAQLESLVDLQLNLTSTDMLRLIQGANLPLTPFPALTSVSVAASQTSLLKQWIDMHPLLTPSSFICQLSRSDDPVLDVQSLQLLETIVTHFDHTSLQSIEIMIDDPRGTRLQLTSIRPLFAFTRLRSLDICSVFMTPLNDGGLQELASSWPLLENLHLNYDIECPSGYFPVGEIPSLRGIFYLLKNCPRLRELSIVVDMEWLSYPRDGTCNTSMSKLVLGTSPIQFPQLVAEIIRKTMPGVRQVDMEVWDQGVLKPGKAGIGKRALWNRVNEILSKEEGEL